jgi:hypothetical protein
VAAAEAELPVVPAAQRMLWAAARVGFEPAEASSARVHSQPGAAQLGATVRAAAPWSQPAERRSRAAVQPVRVAELSPQAAQRPELQAVAEARQQVVRAALQPALPAWLQPEDAAAARLADASARAVSAHSAGGSPSARRRVWKCEKDLSWSECHHPDAPHGCFGCQPIAIPQRPESAGALAPLLTLQWSWNGFSSR